MIALVVFGVLDIALMIYGYLQANAFGTLVAATAIIPYIIYLGLRRRLKAGTAGPAPIEEVATDGQPAAADG